VLRGLVEQLVSTVNGRVREMVKNLEQTPKGHQILHRLEVLRRWRRILRDVQQRERDGVFRKPLPSPSSGIGAPQLPQHLGVEVLLFGKVTSTLAVTVRPAGPPQYSDTKYRKHLVPNVLLFFMLGMALGSAPFPNLEGSPSGLVSVSAWSWVKFLVGFTEKW